MYWCALINYPSCIRHNSFMYSGHNKNISPLCTEVEAQEEEEEEKTGMFCTRPAEGGPKTCRPIGKSQ